MFDTDNDGLEDGEEVIAGADNFLTHANNSDTDNDTLKDGAEVLYVPRPFQEPSNPLINDTDGDGMPDGWEMHVQSAEENTNSHCLWVATTSWEKPGCEETQNTDCTLEPGGYMWQNWLGGFVVEKQYEIWEMNLTGFSMPSNPLCDGCKGRWALDPSLGSLADDNYDIDNDTLMNAQEAPDRWNTNPVDNDTDSDILPDGWEVYYSQLALELGLVDNSTFDSTGARGVMDPAMEDSDLDGINDGQEDPDNDGLNRSGLVKSIVQVSMIQQILIVILILKLLTDKNSTITWRITPTLRRCKMVQIQYPTTLTQINGTMVLKYSTWTMMTMVWQPDGNIISSLILMMQRIEW